ncbi:multidrug efflux ABC transporter permease [Nocardioides sp. AN3]
MTPRAGTDLLLRQNLRRDRIIAPVWLAALAAVCWVSAAATGGLYGTEAERVRAATAINDSPAIVALYGPILDVHSLGELAMTKMTVLYAVFGAVLFVVLVRRHTRVEEESGRAELTGGAAIGRDAPLMGAVAESFALSVVLGALIALADIAGGLDPAGSVAFGCVWLGTGLVATGIAAVCCQVSASARTCGAAAAAVVGALFLLRAAGDASGASWLSWCSPFGWNTQVRAWSDTRWWVLLLYPVLAVGMVAVAQLLRGRRDLGAGLVTARPGPATGSPRLADVVALSWRIHGPALAVWTGAVGVLGLLFGFIAPGLDDLLDTGTAQELIDKLGGQMLAAVLSMVAIVVSCFAVSVLSHAGSDETGGRTEAVLATATSRSRWLLAALLVAVVGSVWLLVVTGLTLWIGYATAGGPPPGDLLTAAVGWSPAIWVVIGLAMVLLALRSSWAVFGWAWPVLFLTLTIVGELAGFPSWLTGLSPYSHVPPMPAEPWRWAPEIGLTVVAAALVAGAWLRFRERDIG